MSAAQPMLPVDARSAAQAAFYAHAARPLDVVTFAQEDLGMPKLFPRQAEFLRKCFPKAARFDSPIFNADVREAIALWGKGSGKDTISACAQLYVTYRLMLHPNPQAWLKLAPGDHVDLINVAYNGEQARTVFFQYVKARLSHSAFFRVQLPSVKNFDAGRDVLGSAIKFPHNVFAHSLHSQARAAEGKNTFFAVMDEADAFTDSSERANADEVHSTLLGSMSSRFPHQHLLIVLSWPRHLESFTVRRFETAMKGEQRAWGSRGATWDIRLDRSKDDFAEDYAKNPERARAMFETLPPATTDAFFKLPEKLDQAFTGQHLVTYEATTTSILGKEYSTLALLSLAPAPKGAAYWLHGDAGLTGDTYAVALARAQGPRRHVEALLEWKPTPGRPVYFPDVRRVIMQLRQSYTVLGASFDRWNSAETIQELNAAGLYAESMTFSQPEQLALYENLKGLVYSDMCVLPADGPAVGTLRRELRRLQLLRGVKVDHPAGESKDVADCVAAAVAKAYEPQVATLGSSPVSQSSLPTGLKAFGAGGFNRDLLKPGW